MLYVEHWSRLSTRLLDMQLFNLRIHSAGICRSGGSATSLLLLLRHMRFDEMLLRWGRRSMQRLLRVVTSVSTFAVIIVLLGIVAFLVLFEMKKGAMESTTLLAFV